MEGKYGSRLGSGAVFQDMTGMLLGQNLPRRLPTTTSSRVLVATWLVFAFILGSAYRGNLTASLTLPKYPPRPETLPELVDTADRITMQPYGHDYKAFFSKSDSAVFQRLSQLINIVPTMVIGQQQAVRRNQAHLDTRRYQHISIAERFTRVDGSELLYIGRESIMPGLAAWPIPHDAPYSEVLNRYLIAVVEAGLYEKWAADMLFRVQQKSRRRERQRQQLADASQSSPALTITHTQGGFIVLLMGLVLASFICITEYMKFTLQ